MRQHQVDAQRGEQLCAFVVHRQAFDATISQERTRVRPERYDDGRSSTGVRAGCQPFDDLLMAPMDTIENANGHPAAAK